MEERVMDGEKGPRKVIVGTAVHPMYGWFPPMDERLDALAGGIDNMAEQAAQKYDGRHPDLVVLPESAVWGASGPAAEKCVPLDGPVLDVMGGKAREHGTNVVVSMFLRESDSDYSNAAVFLDREGQVVGIYRKVFPVVGSNGVLEGGVAAGKDFPVFDLDFGKVGAQICYDMMFDEGWPVLARKGAELVVWPTQSPQTARTRCRALRNGYYVVSSTWRNNAAVYEPTGMIAARITEPGVLVHEIDLEYALLQWDAGLREGAAMTERYGGRVGYNYYASEDRGIFWSNDPEMPIRQMVREAGFTEEQERWDHDRACQDEHRGGPPSLE